MIKVYMFPVGVGDFIWIRFGKGANTNHNILIDGGHEMFSGLYKCVLQRIDSEKQTVLIILTHIDADHIQAAAQGLTELSDDLLRRVVDYVYFNTGRGIINALHGKEGEYGYDYNKPCMLPENRIEVNANSIYYSVRDAEKFLEALKNKGLIHKLVDYTVSGTEMIYSDAIIRFISPGEKELCALLQRYEEYNSKRAIHYTSASVSIKKGIKLLMKERLGYDRSVTNRSSLAFLFEYEGIRGAFLGDAVASVMVEGLKRFDIDKPFKLEFLKIPHHGGKYNMSDKLIQLLPTENYLISTEGIFECNIPSKELIAHLVKLNKKVKLYCNFQLRIDAFFTEEDICEYINTEWLELIELSNEPVKLREGIELYNCFSMDGN